MRCAHYENDFFASRNHRAPTIIVLINFRKFQFLTTIFGLGATLALGGLELWKPPKTSATADKESSDHTITCYTDGSRTGSGVGPGFLATTNNSPHHIINYSYFKLPDFCSVFQAEVTAIREVTTTLQHNRSKTIVIWTYSISTLHSHPNSQEVRPLHFVTGH